MREPENIRAIENTGADWIGFIYYERSPRFVADTPAYLPRHAKRVGVFVNAGFDTITARAEALRLDYVQLHGTESPKLCLELRCHGFHLIKAFAPRTPADLEQTIPYLPLCDYLLFDTPSAGHGGSGKAFDWSLLRFYLGDVPFLLSGGICPESLEALRRFHHPQWAGIDLNSGFETAPGIKDAEKLKKFIERINNVSMNNVTMNNVTMNNEQCDNEQCDNEQCDNEQCGNERMNYHIDILSH